MLQTSLASLQTRESLYFTARALRSFFWAAVRDVKAFETSGFLTFNLANSCVTSASCVSQAGDAAVATRCRTIVGRIPNVKLDFYKSVGAVPNI